jgi:DNA-binding response OmpR family regulator
MKSPTSSKTRSTDTHSINRRGLPVPVRELAAQPSPGESPPGKSILLVDDDPAVRDSLNDVLMAEGYVVIPAENGQQALDLASQSAVDLVLLDLNMPVKNGWDTFEQLTTEHPFVPIVIVTARPNQLFTALSAGAGALLEKPMDIPTLLRTMEQLLAEPAEQRLARLVGKKTEFHYEPAAVRYDQQPPNLERNSYETERQTHPHSGDAHVPPPQSFATDWGKQSAS